MLWVGQDDAEEMAAARAAQDEETGLAVDGGFNHHHPISPG
jgi:predicted NUDIX family NTP pyrophosphohydrolase